MNDENRSAGRVLDVLEHLAGRPDGASLTEICAALELPKSSAHVLLRTVLARGYVTKDRSERYVLNEVFRTYGFGWGGHRHAHLIAVANPIMEELAAAVGETVLLGTVEGGVVRTLSKVVADQVIRYDVSLSTPSPYYCTAMGRVVVAFSPESQRDLRLLSTEREKHTDKTVTDLHTLRRIIERVAEDGYAIVEEEFVVGGTGIAAPVFGKNGEVVAVLDIGCVSARFEANRERLIEALLSSAGLLSQRLLGNSDAHLRGGAKDDNPSSRRGSKRQPG
ncbi:IclR family transcriptional regulator [Mesorhizobium sp. RMAD-H1]|uniref:IclR family transcriptional regulator n=1 Tax=Mesorhizobium sp. RMAD-H1 TaxID=2587065 RepID=UPI001616D379|nr:IclR family transcriptional regulator [Mesorhizobium sp. RMAD-H1]MBB2972298.1 DNA-binding IclR family transcriptional regulator [Mesorhizobium sp. RMAD-H1]